MSVQAEWSMGSRGHSDHPGQKAPWGCPRDHSKGVGGWAPRAPGTRLNYLVMKRGAGLQEPHSVDTQLPPEREGRGPGSCRLYGSLGAVCRALTTGPCCPPALWLLPACAAGPPLREARQPLP